MQMKLKKSKTPYQCVKGLSLPHIKHFKDDLLVHDRTWLRNHPGVPFLHWTRETGTDLCGLFPADHEAWPKAGEEKPYLFSHAKREHFLRHAVIHAQCRARYPKECLLALYFDGSRVAEVSVEKAIEIAMHHERMVLKEWGSRQCCCGSCRNV